MVINFSHDRISATLRDDPEFRLASRKWTARIRLDQGAAVDDLVLEDGKLVSFGPSEGDSWDVRISAPEASWPKLFNGEPDLYWVFPLSIEGFQLEGDLISHLAPYDPAIGRLVTVLRNIEGVPVPEVHVSRDPFEATDNAVGRYIYIDVDGTRFRVYYEEAGTGDIPLLLQHTAGADSRQWRHFLADPAMQAKYRMIAYDLPYHGRSLPPLTNEHWWQNEYAPSRDQLLARVVAISHALELDRPIFLGVSVGGQMASDILAAYPDDFRGSIGVNGWYYSEAVSVMDNEPFHDPRINPEYWSSRQYEGSSNLAPEEFRREVQWIYASNGPAVYKGDNEYYAHDHDLRVNGHLIKPARTPYYAIACEFDPTATMAGGGFEFPEKIPGSKYFELKGLSHFAMADDPVRFNAAMGPILDEMVADTEKIAATSKVSETVH